MNYEKGLQMGQTREPAQAVGGVGQLGVEGPQLLTRLSEQVRGLVELRTRLHSVNKSLRGIQPTEGRAAADTPKPVEISLTDMTRDIAILLEECHSEASEIQALLS